MSAAATRARPRGRIKICGIRDEAGLEACLEAGADDVGFVFHDASPRAVAPGRAEALCRRLGPGTGRIGLFVGADPARIAAVLDRVPLDALQLYDTAARIEALAARTALPLWQALPIADPSELDAASAACAMLVVEARAPAGADRPGGHGIRLDWAALGRRPPARPWMLAGGLAPDNVADAIARSGAPAVDVSSGVERSRGIKDRAAILAFVRTARAAFEATRTGNEVVS